MTFERYYRRAKKLFPLTSKQSLQHAYEAGMAAAIAENKAEYNIGVQDGYAVASEQATAIAEEHLPAGFAPVVAMVKEGMQL